ncbi:MAG: hypothetical protein OSB62_06820 [Alphaproteobacteria bacterium]|nr:hypothetical protein [Alphaproteobacteria bacterium]
MKNKYKFLRLLFLCLSLLSLSFSSFAVENVYRLHNYSGTVGSASERASLLDRLGREAIEDVLKRLLPLGEEQMVSLIASEIPSATVVRSVEVVDEVRSDEGYTLTVNITLERDPIRKAILRRSTAYTDMRPLSVAVIPLWADGRTLYPASSATDWRTLLEEYKGAATLFTYELVSPDILEMSGIKDELFKFGAADALDEIATLAGTDQAAVFMAEKGLSDDIVTLSVFSNAPDIAREQTVFASAEGLSKMAETAFLGYEAAYRNARQMNPEDESNFLLRYKAESVRDIQKVEELLKDASFIQQVGIRLMSRTETVFVINMQTDHIALGKYLAKHELYLEGTNIRNVWRLTDQESQAF